MRYHVPSVMKLTFWGAAGTVTGSMHQLETGSQRYLLDCGMFQGRRKEAEARNRQWPFDPQSIDKVILSHAHIDHSGRIPLLVKDGFSGPIYGTPATIDLCGWMLRDSAHTRKRTPNSSTNAANIARRSASPTASSSRFTGWRTPSGPAAVPSGVVPQPRRCRRLELRMYDAGHILGSSFLRLTDTSGPAPVRLLFSGDLGRPGLP